MLPQHRRDPLRRQGLGCPLNEHSAVRFLILRRVSFSVRKRLKKALLVLGALALSGAAVFAALSWAFIDWSEEGSDVYPGGVVLRDRAGRVIRVSLGEGDVDCRPYYAASRDDWIVKALVAAEDGSFWTHRGVRPASAFRAAWQNICGRRRVSGASTITMQAVRLIKPHPKSLWWKWKEAVMALKMERAKSKEWIISQYLNRAPFGSNLVGIESGARGWFGRGAGELGLGEAAMLAGMVQAPTRFRPDRWGDGARRERAFKRREYVLGRMLELGYITEEQYEGAQSVRPEARRSPRPFEAPHFCDWFLAELAKTSRGRRPEGDFTTTLDADVQYLCEHAVREAAEKGGFSSAAVVVRVADGEVVAMACSGDYFDGRDGQVNTATAPRPAGSTLKPFLVALAMERGLVAPGTKIVDAPMSFKGYRPANFDGKYRGPVTVRDALVLSLNVPFVKLLDEIGVSEFSRELRALGFGHLTEPDETYGLGMAIGNVEVSLLELARAYAALARVDGRYLPETTYLVSDMLSGTERSAAALGHVADVELPRFAWKTGTSSAYRDAWTVAWNPEYAIGVWCGHKSGGFGDKSLVGARAAAPVAWGIARQLYPNGNSPWFAEPPGAARVAARAEEVVRREPGLVLVKPEDGAVFHLVQSELDQRIVCQVGEIRQDAKLWWFVDGAFAGESVGRVPFVVQMKAGSHVVTCATADGLAASASIEVVE